MNKLVLLVAGAGAGLVAAHFVARTPRGTAFFDDVSVKAREFGAAAVDGYKQREAELKAAVAEVGDVIGDLGNRAD
jgi:hypothetical protein